MKVNNVILAAALVLTGSGMAYGDFSNPNIQGTDGNNHQLLQFKNDEGVTPGQSRLESLEARIESLEMQLEASFKGVANNGEASTLKVPPYDEETIQAMNQWSTESHLIKAQEKVVYSEELKTKIQELQDQFDRLSQRPYLDTKGFKRDGLKRLIGSLQKELQEETAKVVWHTTQAQKNS